MTFHRDLFRGSRRPVTELDIRRLIDRIVEELADHARVEVVATVADLPDNAPPTQWYRVVADPSAVYIGNGPNRPLSRFTTTPLS